MGGVISRVRQAIIRRRFEREAIKRAAEREAVRLQRERQEIKRTAFERRTAAKIAERTWYRCIVSADRQSSHDSWINETLYQTRSGDFLMKWEEGAD